MVFGGVKHHGTVFLDLFRTITTYSSFQAHWIEKMGHPKKKRAFQPSIFRCEPLVSGMVVTIVDFRNLKIRRKKNTSKKLLFSASCFFLSFLFSLLFFVSRAVGPPQKTPTKKTSHRAYLSVLLLIIRSNANEMSGGRGTLIFDNPITCHAPPLKKN